MSCIQTYNDKALQHINLEYDRKQIIHECLCEIFYSDLTNVIKSYCDSWCWTYVYSQYDENSYTTANIIDNNIIHFCIQTINDSKLTIINNSSHDSISINTYGKNIRRAYCDSPYIYFFADDHIKVINYYDKKTDNIYIYNGLTDFMNDINIAIKYIKNNVFYTSNLHQCDVEGLTIMSEYGIPLVTRNLKKKYSVKNINLTMNKTTKQLYEEEIADICRGCYIASIFVNNDNQIVVSVNCCDNLDYGRNIQIVKGKTLEFICIVSNNYTNIHALLFDGDEIIYVRDGRYLVRRNIHNNDSSECCLDFMYFCYINNDTLFLGSRGAINIYKSH